MVRIGKQEERRNRCPKKHRAPALKTGPKAEAKSYNTHVNAVEGTLAETSFIPKIK